MKLTQLGLRGKMIGAFLLTGIIPMLTIGIYASWHARNGLTEAHNAQIDVINTLEETSIHNYYKGIKETLLKLSEEDQVVEASKELTVGFNNFKADLALKDDDVIFLKDDLLLYYKNNFEEKFKKDNFGQTYDFENYISQLSPTSVVLQQAYLGTDTDTIDDGTYYSKEHAKLSPELKDLAKHYGYYDLFIVDIDQGNVVYSAAKEIDFATSLLTGPLKDSNLAQAFVQAKAMEARDQVVMVDYKGYAPSYNAAASFMATPIWQGDKKIGVLIIQMPVERLNNLLGETEGRGKTGESYLVGQDHRMRTNSRLAPDVFNSISSFRLGDKAIVKSEVVDKALKGESGVVASKNYLGQDVLSSYTPIDVLGLKWAFVTDLALDEAMESNNQLYKMVTLGIVIALGGIIFMALWFSGWLGKKIIDIAGKLGQRVSSLAQSAVDISNASSKLTDAVNENAAAIQETVSSVDEISAMVQRNADSAAGSTEVSMKSNVTAQNGKQTVEQMIQAIKEIATSNQEVMSQMEKSNKELGSIVAVIKEIGDKTKVINDIVFQTKLLSFNASVEAARAGEQGKGFAVVAEEVGNLANSSGKAAKEITDMLDRSISQVTQIVDKSKSVMQELVKKGRAKVEHGTQTANDCGVALDEILLNISTVNEMVTEIANASSEQATGISEVTKAMAMLDQATQQNANIAQDTNKMASLLQVNSVDLNSVAQELLILIGTDQPGKHVASAKHETPKKTQAPAKPDLAVAPDPAPEEEKSRVLNFPEKSERKLAVAETSHKEASPLPLKSTGTDDGIPDRNDPRFEEI